MKNILKNIKSEGKTKRLSTFFKFYSVFIGNIRSIGKLDRGVNI